VAGPHRFRREEEQAAVNNRPAISGSSFGRQSTLNTVGVIVLVLGLTAASIVLVRGLGQSNSQAASNSPDDWQDNTLSIQDSKASSHDVEMYDGKLGLLTLELSHAFHQPESLAMIIATTSTLFALGCFSKGR
jgi:hypothetical protein